MSSLSDEAITLTLQGTTATLHLYSGRKYAHVCNISFVWSNNTSSSAGVDYTMGTLSVAPKVETYAPLISTTGQIIGILTAKTNGQLHVYFYSTYTANQQMLCNFSYMSN